jgi:hypothetical protein
LGHQLDATASRMSRAAGRTDEVYAIENYRTGLRSVKSHDGFGNGRLPRTRFTHDAYRGSLADCQVNSSKNAGAL